MQIHTFWKPTLIFLLVQIAKDLITGVQGIALSSW